MAFGAMAGYAHASMVPPGGFKPGMSSGSSMGHGYGYSFGSAVGDLKTENASLTEQNASLKKQVTALKRKKVIPDLVQYHEEHPKGLDPLRFEGQYMSRDEFRKILARDGLIETQPGAKHEGQHVYHIIATSNGGPDHTDNYLYALGGSFNIAVGDRFDHLNCFLAGKAKAEKAVAIAIKVANDPSLHMHIEKRGKAKQVTFRDGRHGSIQSGGQLYKMGEDLFRDMRAAAR